MFTELLIGRTKIEKFNTVYVSPPPFYKFIRWLDQGTLCLKNSIEQLVTISSSLDLRRTHSLWLSQQCRKKLTGLIRVVVDRLFPEDNDVGFFLLNDLREQLSDGKRLKCFVILLRDGHVNATVHSHRKCRTNHFLGL